MSENVQMTFSADDNLSQAIERINQRLNELEKSSDKTEKKGSNLDGMFKKLTTTISAAAIGMKAYQFATQGIAKAKGDITAATKLEAVVKATGKAAGLTADQLKNMANEMSLMTTESSGALMQAESLLLTFKNIGSDTFPRAMKSITDMSMMFGGLDSSAMKLGKALNDPIQGMSALKMVGIFFTAAQEEMIKALVNSGDVAGAQAIILKELEEQIGGVNAAILATPVGQLQQQQNIYDDLQAVIGEKLLPILVTFQKVINAITSFMIENGEVLSFAVVTGGIVMLIPKIIALTGAIGGLNAMMMANPFFLGGAAIIAGITAIAGAVKYFSKEVKIGTDRVEILTEKVKNFTDLENMSKSLDKIMQDVLDRQKGERQKAIDEEKKDYQKRFDELKKMFSDEQGNLTINADPSNIGNSEKAIQLAQKANTVFEALESEHKAKLMQINNKYDTERLDAINKLNLDMMSAREKELTQLEQDYNKNKSIFAGHKQDLLTNEQWYLQQKREINKKYDDEYLNSQEVLADKILQIQEKNLEFQKGIESERYAAIKEVMLKNMGEEKAARIQLDDELSAKKRDITLGMTKDQADAKLQEIGWAEYASAREKELDEELDAIKQQNRQQQIDDTMEIFGTILSVTETTMSSIQSIMDNVNSKRLAAIDKEREKEIDAVKNSKMSKREKEKEIAKIEKEAAKHRHELALQEWRQNLAMSIVNTAMAVSKTLASTPYPANIPLGIAAGVAGAIQTGIIAANKPKLAGGGFIPGQSYSGDTVNAGNAMVNSGEAVLNPSQQREFMAIANGNRSNGQNINVGDTNIIVQGNADSNTVSQLEATLANHRSAIIESLYQANNNREIDWNRLQPAY